MSRSRLFVTAKPGDFIRIGSSIVYILANRGKVRVRIEADTKLAIEQGKVRP